jgi:hypothetical protein
MISDDGVQIWRLAAWIRAGDGMRCHTVDYAQTGDGSQDLGRIKNFARIRNLGAMTLAGCGG